MRKIYTCKSCNQQTEIIDGICRSNSPVFQCSNCFSRSDTSAIENWADILWISFDQDIQSSIDDGSFDLMFPEICPIQ